MLIDPECCRVYGVYYHFKTRILFSDKLYVVTLFLDDSYWERGLLIGNRGIDEEFNIKTPKHIKEQVLKFLDDPLVEIEMLRKIEKYIEDRRWINEKHN